MLSKKLGLYAALLMALIGAGAAYSAASPSAKLQKQDRVYGGGQFGPGCFSNSTGCFDNPRNFAVDAQAAGDGTGAAGNSTYGTPGIGESSRSVRCLRIHGNTAVVGGVILTGPGAGWGYVQFFVDRGGPGLGDRDLASPSFTDPLDAAGWPAGFPNVCPSTTESYAAYREVDEGDVVVQDAPND
jgi:hypothetical protein